MNLFLAEELSETGGKLDAVEAHHALRVLRLSPGDPLLVTQGKGVIYKAELTSISKQEALFKNQEIYSQEEKTRHLHIAIAPTKSNDRFEFFLEKATEVGIDEITPIICRNSERKVYKTERGQKIITSAAKQSLACRWPKLNEPVKLNDFAEDDLQVQKFIAHCEKDDMPNILPQLPSFSKILMLIGPEGDFSPSEIEWARQCGFKECSLGKKRLRTETAGITVALAFHMV